MLALVEAAPMAIPVLIFGLNFIYGFFLLLTGLFFAALTYPLIKGMVKMNHYYGVRFPRSYNSDEAWYKINAYGGRLFMIWGVFLAIAGATIIFIPITDYVVGLGIFLVLFATIIVPISLTYIYARNFNPGPGINKTKSGNVR
jgi:hypothetical protein